MTEFNLNDAKIVLSMTLFLILISFVFPAVGFASHDVNTSDIPEFNVTKGTFDFVQTVPPTPSNPSEGTLKNVDNAELHEDNRQVYLQRGDPEILISLVNFNGTTNPEPEVNLIKFNSTGTFTDTKRINESEFVTIENHSYIIAFENLQIENEGQSDMTLTVDWEIVEQPSDSGWLSRIAVVGGIVSGAEQLAAVVGWIGSIFWNIGYNFIVGSTNLATVVYNIISFFTGIGWFLITTYASVIANAPTSYVALFLSIPGLLLSYEFAKLVIILKKQIPVLG